MTTLAGTRQFSQIPPAHFRPKDCARRAGIKIGDAFLYLLVPGSHNRVVNLATEIGDQGFGERLLFFDR